MARPVKPIKSMQVSPKAPSFNPTPFLLFINDLPQNVLRSYDLKIFVGRSFINTYVDDAMVYLWVHRQKPR